MLETLLHLIESYNTITIYRHQNPDCDALGSQFGLKQWIKDNYPNKDVYCLGNQEDELFPKMDVVEEKIIKQSLAIILDTANSERIDDERYKLANKSIKIDHHPCDETYGTYNYIYSNMAATCEILAQYFYDMKAVKIVSKECATYLYHGLLTDTLSFKTPSTSANTLFLASFLASKDIDIAYINQRIFNKSLDVFQFVSYLRSKLIIDDHVGYIVLSLDELKQYNQTASMAKNCVSEFGGIKEITTWAIFAEVTDGVFDGSLRSRCVQVNDLASKYHGGGHYYAAGVKHLTIRDIEALMQALKERACKYIN